MNTLYIIIPAYNEEENIVRLISDWYPVIETYNPEGRSRLVVIDDGSRDETYHLLEKMAVSRPLLVPLTKPNAGHGPTLISGYRYALKNGADYVFQTDSDGQTDPAEFGKFYLLRDKYDAVFGMRPERGDGKIRAVIERVLCGILKLIFGVSIPDANCPYRLMSASYLKEYLPKLPKNYNLPNVMLTVFGVYDKRRVRFLPVTFRPRQGGVNSVNFRKITLIGFAAVQDFLSFRRLMRRK